MSGSSGLKMKLNIGIEKTCQLYRQKINMRSFSLLKKRGYMKKRKTIWVRHDYNTDEPLAVANNFKELQKKKSEWVKKKGKDNCVYDREYIQIPEEGESICGKKHYPRPLRYCPHCGEKLFYKDEEMLEIFI